MDTKNPETTIYDLQIFDIHNGFSLPLQDGELVDFRPVQPDDRERLQNGMSALSLQSRYFRFFTPVSKLSDALLNYLTEADQSNHVAWIATAPDEPSHPGLGIARFIRIYDQPHIAEFAVVVIETYKRRGLGRILIAILYLIAQIEGIEVLRAFVLPENTTMITWLHRLGANGKYENGIYRMDIGVCNDLSCSGNNPSIERFRYCIEKLIAQLQGNTG